jgi:hypothetical protein
MNWVKMIQGDCSLHSVNAKDSGHLFVSPHVEKLGHQLTEAISEASGKNS